MNVANLQFGLHSLVIDASFDRIEGTRRRASYSKKLSLDSMFLIKVVIETWR